MSLVAAVEELFRQNDPNDRQKSGDARSVLHCSHGLYMCALHVSFSALTMLVS